MIRIKEKFAFLILTLLFLACGGLEEKNNEEKPFFNISGDIEFLPYQTAYLALYKDGGFVKVDSVTIEEGVFSFEGSVEHPSVQYILFDNAKDRLVVFVENSHITITGKDLHQENIKIAGSDINTQLEKFIIDVKAYETALKKTVDQYYAAEAQGNTTLLNELDAKYLSQDSARRAFVEGYINDNLSSVIAPYLSLRYMMENEISELEKLSNSFAPEIRGSEYVQLIDEHIAASKSTEVGQLAPLFSMADQDGNQIALESFRGKYVLVDFWASWCGPCRAENPNVVAAYNKYHDKGFEVFGVSFDDNKAKWLKAIEDDHLTWTHVSDLRGWANAAGQLYRVRGIPYSVLLDQEGAIVAKNLRGEELQYKLAEIFAE